MPKSKLEMKMNGDFGSSSTASADESEQVLNLREQIQALKEAIALKTEQIANQEKHIGDYIEGLSLVKSKSRWTPKPGELEPFDALQQLLGEAKNDLERRERIAVAEKALQLSKQRYSQLEAERVELCRILAECEKELYWYSTYERYTGKYHDAFNFPPTPEQKRRGAIADLQQAIKEKQDRLKLAEQILKAPKTGVASNLPAWTYPFPPSQVIESHTDAIATLQKKLQLLSNEPLEAPDPRVQESFREFVISRARLEPSLKKLMATQDAYISALEEFKAIAKSNAKALTFSVEALPEEPPLVLLDERDRITLKVPYKPEPIFYGSPRG